MKPLSPDEISAGLQTLPDWTLRGNAIRREYSHATFPDAIAFVVRVAEFAEAADHHPDIDIRFNKVLLTLSTHSTGGLTEKDFALARRIDDEKSVASTRDAS